jgi:3',5'-cyclic AMP phosphodiesterase CpdA
VHLDAASPLYGRVDTGAALRAALDLVRAMTPAPEALLLSGDLVNDGTPEDYRAVRSLVEPVARELGCPMVVVPGNHDVVGVLREHLLGEPASDAALDSAVLVGGLRIVALDTSVAGAGHGELSRAQLDWLAAELDSPAPEGTVLMLHHPPLPSPVGLIEELALRERDRLTGLLEGTDVRLILCGHTHHAGAGAVAGIPVWIAPAVAYTSDVTAPPDLFRGMAGATGITRIDVHADTAVATLIPLEGRDPVVELGVTEALRGD